MISTWLHMSSHGDDTIYTCTPRFSSPSSNVDSHSLPSHSWSQTRRQVQRGWPLHADIPHVVQSQSDGVNESFCGSFLA